MFFGNTMSVQVFQQTALHKYTCPQFRGFQLQTQTRMQTMYQIILMKFCDSSKVKANVLKPMYLISIFKALVHTVLHRAGTTQVCYVVCFNALQAWHHRLHAVAWFFCAQHNVSLFIDLNWPIFTETGKIGSGKN